MGSVLLPGLLSSNSIGVVSCGCKLDATAQSRNRGVSSIVFFSTRFVPCRDSVQAGWVRIGGVQLVVPFLSKRNTRVKRLASVDVGVVALRH
jgi:hypothetical protein